MYTAIILRTCIFILMWLVPRPNKAQTLTVSRVTDAYLNNVKILMLNDRVELKNNTVTVRAGGIVSFSIEPDRSFGLGPGTYSLDSCYRSNMAAYKTHDSIISVLRGKGLEYCSFSYPPRCLPNAGIGPQRIGPDTTDGHIITGYDKGTQINTSKDTFLLRWKNPKPYSGSYYVVCRNMFDEYLFMTVTTGTECILPLAGMRKEMYIQVRIIAADCRESWDLYLELK